MPDFHELAAKAASSTPCGRMTARRNAAFDAMPMALRALDAWGFYTAPDSKRPWSLHACENGFAPGGPRDKRNILAVNDPTSWSSWVACRAARDNAYLLGPGFVLAESMELVFIDLDDPRKGLMQRPAFAALPPDQQDRYIGLCHTIMEKIIAWGRRYGAWMQRSHSGRGVHLFMFGRLPHPQYEFEWGGSIFTRRRFAAMTGRVLPGAGSDVPRNDAALLELVNWLLSLNAIRKQSAAGQTAHVGGMIDYDGRRLDLTDDEVLDALANGNAPSRSSWRTYHLADGHVADWSASHAKLVGDLEKITGNPDQILRLLLRSPFVLQTPAKAGEDRHAKCNRIFDDEFAKARNSNDALFKLRKERSESIAKMFSNMIVG